MDMNHMQPITAIVMVASSALLIKAPRTKLLSITIATSRLNWFFATLVCCWTLNPSYMPLFLFQRLAKVDPSGPWQQITFGIPRMLEGSARHGYAMDWVNYIPGDGFFPAPAMATGNKDSDVPGGSYDAIRVYLWAGMLDQKATARSTMLSSLSGMRAYIVTHGIPPERVAADGAVIENHAPVGFSAAVIPFLLAVGEHAAANTQSDRLKHERVAADGLYGRDQRYYDQNLALFSQGWTDGLFHFDASGQLQLRWKAS